MRPPNCEPPSVTVWVTGGPTTGVATAVATTGCSGVRIHAVNDWVVAPGIVSSDGGRSSVIVP